MAITLSMKVFSTEYSAVEIRPLIIVTATNDGSAVNGSLVVSFSGHGATGSNTVAIQIPGNATSQLYRINNKYIYNSSTSDTLTITAKFTSNDGDSVTTSRTFKGTTWDIGVACDDITLGVGGAWGRHDPATIELGTQSEITIEQDGNGYKHTFKVYSSSGWAIVLDNVGYGTWHYTPQISAFAPLFTATETVHKTTAMMSTYNVDGSLVYEDIVPYNVSLALPSSVRPTIISVTPSDTEGYRNTYGVYVGTKSTLQASVEVSGIYGSTITKVAHQIDDLSVSTTDPSTTKLIGRLNQSGSRILKTTVTDSRGRTEVKNTDITVAPYVLPSVSLTANRWDTIDNEVSDGSDTVRLDIGGNIPSINNHLVEGTLTVQGRQKNASQWTVISTISVSGTIEETVYAYNQVVDSNWDYRVVLTDSFGTAAESESSVGTATPILEFHSSGKGMGIGTIAPEVGLDVGMQADFKGTAEDGFSRIQITDPEGNDSVILANLAGSELQLLTNALGSYDRAKIGSHIFMQNNLAIGGITTSGGQTDMLRLNSSDQVELNWTSGGLKGRVFKQIWSGTWSGGSITVSEAPYYNLFGFNFGNPSRQTWTGLGFRNGNTIHAFTFSWNSSDAPICSVAVKITVSGTSLSLAGKSQVGLWLNEWDKNTLQSNAGITKIWGIL